MRTCIIALALLSLVLAANDADKMGAVPGYDTSFNTSVYSGYLSTGSDSRKLHYLFVESKNGVNNTDPLTLWLNGGPGCSSLLGFLQEIGPYYLEDGKNYKDGDNLAWNQYSWHNVSNLLFIESPAGVGFSYNTDTKYRYNDSNTAQDALSALNDWFNNFQEYKDRKFFIAGQSYAGKYIPDLAVLIDKQNNINSTKQINLKGILVGNGIMDFSNGELEKSSIEFMLDRDFVDPELISYYKGSCLVDPESAGCNYFTVQYEQDTSELNPYNVYGYCFYNSTMKPEGKKVRSQSDMLRHRLSTQFPELYSKNSMLNHPILTSNNKYNGNAPCAFFDGMSDYFKINAEAYKAKWKGMAWNGPCAENITYDMDLKGSMDSYKYLVGRQRLYTIALYNGDWDDVVPYTDTLKNMKRLNLEPNKAHDPWFVDSQHAGFNQYWSGVDYITVKGASHQVPQAKRKEALQLFINILSGHG